MAAVFSFKVGTCEVMTITTLSILRVLLLVAACHSRSLTIRFLLSISLFSSGCFPGLLQAHCASYSIPSFLPWLVCYSSSAVRFGTHRNSNAVYFGRYDNNNPWLELASQQLRKYVRLCIITVEAPAAWSSTVLTAATLKDEDQDAERLGSRPSRQLRVA